MKKVLVLSAIIIFLCTAIVSAKPIISADDQYYDTNTGLYILTGNVNIQVGSRLITAGTAKVNMLGLEVWGSKGVTVTQDDIYFTGDNVYVCGLNHLANISGGVKFSRTGLTICADNVDFNWNTKLAVFSGNVKVDLNNETSNYNNITYNVATNTIAY